MSLSLSPGGISPAASLTLARRLPARVEEMSQMSPLDLFKMQMGQGYTEAQVDAMKRLPVVAFAMGSTATLKELVPYLQNLCQKRLDDELLLLLAKQLQTFIPPLLTTAHQMLERLPIVERLAAVDETVVWDEAVVLLNHICKHVPTLPDTAAISALISMAKRLVAVDWFTAKVSVAGMFPALHAHQELRDPLPLQGAASGRDSHGPESCLIALGATLLASLGAKDSSLDLISILQQLMQGRTRLGAHVGRGGLVIRWARI